MYSHYPELFLRRNLARSVNLPSISLFDAKKAKGELSAGDHVGDWHRLRNTRTSLTTKLRHLPFRSLTIVPAEFPAITRL